MAEVRLVPPNILATEIYRRKTRIRGRGSAFAKVGVAKKRRERVEVDPSTILVPAKLPEHLEQELPPPPAMWRQV